MQWAPYLISLLATLVLLAITVSGVSPTSLIHPITHSNILLRRRIFSAKGVQPLLGKKLFCLDNLVEFGVTPKTALSPFPISHLSLTVKLTWLGYPLPLQRSPPLWPRKNFTHKGCKWWLCIWHLWFKAEASTCFEILVKLQFVFVWVKGEKYKQLWQIHVTTLRNPGSNIDKSMQQLRKIHASILTNPCNN